MRGRRAVAMLASLAVVLAVGVAASAPLADARRPRQAFPKVDQPGVSETEIRVGGVASITNPLGTEHSAAFDSAQKFIEENAPFFEGSYALTFFTRHSRSSRNRRD